MVAGLALKEAVGEGGGGGGGAGAGCTGFLLQAVQTIIALRAITSSTHFVQFCCFNSSLHARFLASITFQGVADSRCHTG